MPFNLTLLLFPNVLYSSFSINFIFCSDPIYIGSSLSSSYHKIGRYKYYTYYIISLMDILSHKTSEKYKKIRETILNDLNPSQREAVTTTEGPIAVIAGAGSGKTRVVTRRIAYIIAEGLSSPHTIFASTFTNKAAKEMKERVEELLGKRACDEMWIGTFHSLCSRLLRIFGEAIGIDRRFVIYDTEDQKALVKEIMKDMGLDVRIYPPAGIVQAISRAKNDLTTPVEYPRDTSLKQVEAIIYDEYQRRLAELSALDFGDLIMQAVRLLQSKGDVRQKVRDRFKYILVDEFQDTNLAQYRLLEEITGLTGNICVVGDPDQSIYRWRGANIENIDRFLSSFTPRPKIISLEQNYRSTQLILNSANCLIRFNRGVNTPEKNLYSDLGEGMEPVIYRALDERDEAHFVAKVINAYSNEMGYNLKDFCVLYRTHAQSRQIESALRGFGTPYTIVGGLRFYERKEIKDILAYLRLVANPRDDISFIRAITNPPRGIGQGTIGKITEYAKKQNLSLFEAIGDDKLIQEIPSHRLKILRNFTGLIKDLQKKVNDGGMLSSILTDIMERSEYLQMLEDEGTIEARGRIENLKELIGAVIEFESELPAGEDKLTGFLEAVSLITDIDNWDRNADAVSLMTLHSAKGLEFPVVFIIGLEEGLLPHINSMGDEEELEEERRLCYVGITRAKKHLFLTYAVNRFYGGDEHITEASRFINEISQSKLKYLESEGIRVRDRYTGIDYVDY
ncbi:MAG: ATP-dependent DNA helicase PcrA [Candidatus Coatesbacteria bacterium]|nr:MAG: ATP-dependent DNA helicase PcrA [Candidatus Coatesbacteria bacterium]